jgi:hypothetical protein
MGIRRKEGGGPSIGSWKVRKVRRENGEGRRPFIDGRFDRVGGKAAILPIDGRYI